MNSSFSYGQNGSVTIAGKVLDAGTRDGLIGVSIQVKGKVIGTITDASGTFELTTTTRPPFQIIISSVGYESQEVEISGNRSDLEISLKEQAIMGQEVIVSASRVEESVMKSPVAVERMDIRAIRDNPAGSFYDGLANLKGIDLTTQGLLFKSINMRGFGATGNPRTVQMIDGMDNSAPGLNFPIDNIVGIPELDLESVDVLPGAASALYGPNAINGLVLMNSKSPFLYQGLSASVKTGIMSANNRDVVNTPFYDASIRYAKAFNNKWAYKVNVSYIQAQDWQASDATNLNVGGVQDGTRGAGVNNDYDGMNYYGDEVQANLNTVGQSLVGAGLLPANALGLLPSTNVSRTGFAERDLVDYNTKSFKTNLALHYRINDKIEAIGQFNYGYGTTVYTGTGRYSLRNFNLAQGKLELRGDNFTVRAYTTQERSGDSYLAGLAAVSMLNEIKPHATWFGEYAGAFVQARAQGAAQEQAFLLARQFADRDMPAPGSERFNSLLNKWRDTPISENGSNFLDRTNMYHAEGLYNFKNEIKVVELLVGANVRQYQLRSNGTLFADTKDGRDGSIGITEYGAFVQAGKQLFKDHLKLSGSLRYDKNENFDGQFTPRLSAVTTFGNHNIRLSYQSGFRIPTTQNQYIDLRTPNAILIGGLDEFNNRYNLQNGILRQNLDPAVIAQYAAQPAVQQQAQQYATAAITQQVNAAVTAAVNAAVTAGQIPNNPQVIAGAIQQGVAAQLPGALQANLPGVVAQVLPAFALAAVPKYQAPELKPERIASYEIGYKGVIGKKLFVDAYYYFSKYTNFIGSTVIIVPTAPAGPGLPIESGVGSASTRIAYSRPANTNESINVQGFAISADYSLAKGYYVGGNMANNELGRFVPTPEQQYAGFNTPTNRYNLKFGRRIGAANKVGFTVSYRHQDAFVWEAGFVQPTTTTVPLFSNTTVQAINNIDAQVSMKMPGIKSILKVGGTNLFGKPYVQAYGSAAVGSMYYISLTFDELLN
nr:carboxypeptidase-like regulatory domain-containing protein [Arundinibacter roseus]